MERTALEALKERLGEVRFASFELDLSGFAGHLDQENTNTKWHQIALEGEWSGHFMGPFKFDKDLFEQMVSRFKAKPNGRVVVDYEHDTHKFFSSRPAIAAGWITDINLRTTDQGAGLFARVEWTEKAAEHIRNREYSYLSPTVAFQSIDRVTGDVTGPELLSVALTNIPFLEELPEVRLNAFLNDMTGGKSPSFSKPQEKLAMDEKQKAALAKIFGLDSAASTEDIMAKAASFSMGSALVADVSEALGLERTATPGEIKGTVTALKQNQSTLEAKVAELQTTADKVKVIEAQQRFDKARSEGKITGTIEDEASGNAAYAWTVCQKDPKEFEAYCKTLSIVPVKPVQPRTDAQRGENVKLDDDELKLCRQMGMKPEDYLKYSTVESYDFKFNVAKGA